MKKITTSKTNHLFQATILGLALTAFSPFASNGALLVQMDFNDSAGNQSLVNRGTLDFTAQFVRQTSPSTVVFDYGTEGSVPPNDNGIGYAAVGAPGQNRGKIYLGNDISTPSHLSSLDNLAQMTLTGWINPGTNAGKVSLFDNSNGNVGWRFEYDTASNVFSVRDGSNSRDFSGSAWTTGQWQFFGLVFDGTAAIGERFALYSGDGTTLSAPIFAAGNVSLGANNGNLTTIGGSTGTFTNEYFVGSLDSFRAYNTNESANLLTIMQTPTAVPEPSTYAMFLGGLITLLVVRRRRRA